MDSNDLLRWRAELELSLAHTPMEQEEKLKILNRVLLWVEEEIDGN